jgi:hypothetical protein
LQVREFRAAFEAEEFDPIAIRDKAELLYGVLPAGRVSKFQHAFGTRDPITVLDLIDGLRRHDVAPPPRYHGINRLLFWDRKAQDMAANFRQKLIDSLTGGMVKPMTIDATADRLPDKGALKRWERRTFGFGGKLGALNEAQKKLLELGRRLPRNRAGKLNKSDLKLLDAQVVNGFQPAGQLPSLLRLANPSPTHREWLKRIKDADAKSSVLRSIAKIALFLSDLEPIAPPPLIWDNEGPLTAQEQAAGRAISQALELQRKGVAALEAADQTRAEQNDIAVFNLFAEMLAGVQLVLNEYGYTAEVPSEMLARFNLRVLGRYFMRPTGQRDGRSEHFCPDEWQQRLLDVVDHGRSALIAAPTSSGKTFICFYAMEQVLRACVENECKAVYISPTKALVNQIGSEIDARFRKTYRRAGAVTGMFTADDRYNLDNCQILVATPECLAILLMNPIVGEKWRKALKWVIFDEVHTYVALLALRNVRPS